jgi:hypothetical protein
LRTAIIKAGNLAEAKRVAMLIPDADDKSLTLSAIADRYIKAGNLAEAKRGAMLISDADDKSWVLSYIDREELRWPKQKEQQVKL